MLVLSGMQIGEAVSPAGLGRRIKRARDFKYPRLLPLYKAVLLYVYDTADKGKEQEKPFDKRRHIYGNQSKALTGLF